jgi:hypothetical protein
MLQERLLMRSCICRGGIGEDAGLFRFLSTFNHPARGDDDDVDSGNDKACTVSRHECFGFDSESWVSRIRLHQLHAGHGYVPLWLWR